MRIERLVIAMIVLADVDGDRRRFFATQANHRTTGNGESAEQQHDC
jgi:hypothetical protein